MLSGPHWLLYPCDFGTSWCSAEDLWGVPPGPIWAINWPRTCQTLRRHWKQCLEHGGAKVHVSHWLFFSVVFTDHQAGGTGDGRDNMSVIWPPSHGVWVQNFNSPRIESIWRKVSPILNMYRFFFSLSFSPKQYHVTTIPIVLTLC
jgi:hypothetical protein